MAAAFLETEQDMIAVRTAFERLGVEDSEVNQGGIKEAIKVFSKKQSPQFLVVDISKSTTPVADFNELSEACDPAIKVIAVGVKNDVSLYRDLINLGISDYLVSPLFADLLEGSLNSVFFEGGAEKKSNQKLGKVILFAGSRGGVGTTLIATSFATLLSEERARRVVLLDTDFHFGTVSLYFDLHSNNGLKDALENPQRIDPLFIERLLVPVNDKLFILTSNEDLDEQVSLKIEGVQTLLAYLRTQFHYVIVDVPHDTKAVTNSLLSTLGTLVLVTDASLAGLRDTGRIIRLFDPEKEGREVVVVMNKCGIYDKGEVSQGDFEVTLKHRVDYKIPFDRVFPMEAINEGKSVVEKSGPLSDAIKEIADGIMGGGSTRHKSSGGGNWLSNLFKLKN